MLNIQNGTLSNEAVQSGERARSNTEINAQIYKSGRNSMDIELQTIWSTLFSSKYNWVTYLDGCYDYFRELPMDGNQSRTLF